MALSTGLVRGRFVSSEATGSLPTPIKGTATFTPQMDYLLSGSTTTVLATQVVAVLDGEGDLSSAQVSERTGLLMRKMGGEYVPGEKGIRLIATDDPDSNPRNWTWKVDFDFVGPNGVKIPYKSFSFSLPSNEVVDLNTVTPVPGISGHSTIKGPKGDSVEFFTENPDEIRLPKSGYITAHEGKLYGYSDGHWTTLMENSPSLQDQKVENVSEKIGSLTFTKTGDTVLVVGTHKSDSYTSHVLPFEFYPEEDGSFCFHDMYSTEPKYVMTSTSGTLSLDEGTYSVSLMYRTKE